MREHRRPPAPAQVDDLFGYVPPAGVLGEVCWPTVFAHPQAGAEQPASLLVHDLSLAWSQPIRRVFEVGPPRPGGGMPTGYLVGPANYALHGGLVAAPVVVAMGFYRRYTAAPPGADPPPPLACEADVPPEGGPNWLTWTMRGVVIEAVGSAHPHGSLSIQTDVSGRCDCVSPDQV
jgi:hypothetical protein